MITSTKRQRHIEELRNSINSRNNTNLFIYLSIDYIKLYLSVFILPPYALYKLIKNESEIDQIIRIIWIFVTIMYLIYLIGILL